MSCCGWSETNLDKVSGIPEIVHNILHQAISFIWFKNIRPEQSWLTKVVFISRVVSGIKFEVPETLQEHISLNQAF
jgi:hypothetical protein